MNVQIGISGSTRKYDLVAVFMSQRVGPSPAYCRIHLMQRAGWIVEHPVDRCFLPPNTANRA